MSARYPLNRVAICTINSNIRVSLLFSAVCYGSSFAFYHNIKDAALLMARLIMMWAEFPLYTIQKDDRHCCFMPDNAFYVVGCHLSIKINESNQFSLLLSN